MIELPRDHGAERRLLDLAGEAGGLSPIRQFGHVIERHPAVVSLEQFAAHRARPGGVLLPPGRDLLIEAAEEIADCAGNYLLWEAVRCEPGMARNEHAAGQRYDRAMRALAFQVRSWHELAITSS